MYYLAFIIRNLGAFLRNLTYKVVICDLKCGYLIHIFITCLGKASFGHCYGLLALLYYYWHHFLFIIIILGKNLPFLDSS